jgi:hypothetical protein
VDCNGFICEFPKFSAFDILSPMAQTSKSIPRVLVSVVLDKDVRDAVEAYAVHAREKRNPLIQRLIIEHLSKNGFWPPAPKEKKARA